MKKFCVLRVIGISILIAAALNAASFAENERNSITIGEKATIFSKILNEKRTLLVSTPAGYEEDAEVYPVLFLLDGETHFQYVAALAKYLGSIKSVPPMLVVGIQNTDRTRDMTPLSQKPDEIKRFPSHGGAENFLAFITKELAPWLKDNYRTGSYRILAGHSHGGLFVINAMFTDPAAFNAYLSISPSLQWNDQSLVKEADVFFGNTKLPDFSLFLSAGNEGGSLLGGIRKFSGILDEKAPENLAWHFEHMPTESHASVSLRSTQLGLLFIFSDWELSDPMKTYNESGMGAIEQFYEKRDKKYGYNTGVPAHIIIRLIAENAAAGSIDSATDLLFKYYEAVKPPAFFLENLANENRKQGNRGKAIELYRLVLKANPNSQSTKKALTELERTKTEKQ